MVLNMVGISNDWLAADLEGTSPERVLDRSQCELLPSMVCKLSCSVAPN